MHLMKTLLLGWLALSSGQAPSQSALLSDPKGWVDLLADKVGHELPRYGAALGDFVLHVEWRFTKLKPKRLD
jgi:hypothetical protein